MENYIFSSRTLEASATLYTDKILIVTNDKTKNGLRISSTKISLLPIDIDTQKLGLTVRHHLTLTETDLPSIMDWKEVYSKFLKAAGFKNQKEEYKDASYLLISQNDDKITILPTKNGGATGKQRGFRHLRDREILIDSNTIDSDLGQKIKTAWASCERV